MNQRGFNLTNILVTFGVAAALVVAWRFWERHQTLERTTALVQAQADKIRDRYKELLKSDPGWLSTLSAAENAGMACLRDHASCAGKGGPFSLRDGTGRILFDATLPVNGIGLDGTNCAAFREGGNDSCPFRVDLSWKPQCGGGDCTYPRFVSLEAKVRFRPSPTGPFATVQIPEAEFQEQRQVTPGDPRNCLDHLKLGRDRSGIYNVRPSDSMPAFPVYCDQMRDGGGWALLASASTPDYSSFPELTAITPSSVGRLPHAEIAALLEASASHNVNNLRLELPEVDGGLVLYAGTAGAVDADAYTARPPVGDCRKVAPEPINPAKHTAGPNFTLSFSGPGEVELSDRSGEREGFHGFRVCFGTTPDGRDCGVACGRLWRGQLYHQKGTVWVR